MININRLKSIRLLCLLLFLPLLMQAQPDLKALDKYIEQARQAWHVPGISVAIVKDGEIVWARGYGTLQAGGKQKVDAHTNFAIASNTKAFIAAALGRLVWQGQLNWDDKVRDYLPEFSLYDDYASNQATVRDLLCHRLGLGTFSGDVIWYKSNYTAAEVIRHIRYVPQAYGFRAGYGYSNLMFITAGEVLRAASGMSWHDYLQQYFFQPLQMTRTVTSVKDLEKMDNVAVPHKEINGHMQPIAWVNWDNMGAAGGIISNAEDMARWMLLQLQHGINGQDTLFSPAVQTDMWTPHNNFRLGEQARQYMPERNYSGYGLGWGLSDYRGYKVVSHSGGYDGMYSRVTLLPGAGLGIVVLTNAMTGIATPLTMHIVDAYLGAPARDWQSEALARADKRAAYKKNRVAQRLAARVSNTQPTVALQDLAGTYYDPLYGNITVTLDGAQLTLNFEPAPDLQATLTHWHYNTFKINWQQVHAWFDFGTVRFVMDNNNRVTGLEFDVPNDDIFFDEIHAKKIK